MTSEEKHAVVALLDEAKAQIDKEHAPGGYNIGVNIGKAGGQSRMHVHVHLIPRYVGDVADPSGGIRCVLPRRPGQLTSPLDRTRTSPSQHRSGTIRRTGQACADLVL